MAKDFNPGEMDRMMLTVPNAVKGALGDYAAMQMSEMFLKEKAEKEQAKGKELRSTALEILKAIISANQVEGNDAEMVERAAKMAQKLHDLT